MKRHHLISIHMILSTFFLPFLLLMPISGTLHLLGFKGEQESREILKAVGSVPSDVEEKEAFFRNLFKQNNIDYDFEYIKESGSTLIFRPTSQKYVTAEIHEDQITLTSQNPNFVKMMMELHKGHGPNLFRNFEKVFGVGLLLMTITGMWMAIVIPAYRIKLGISFLLGALCFALALSV